MPVEFHWLDADHTLNLWTFDESFTWDEYDSLREQAQSDRPFYVIVDCSQLQNLPENTLSHLPRLIVKAPDTLQFTVLAGVPPGFTETVARIFAAVYRGVRFAPTVEDAKALIEEHRRNQSA